MVGRGEAVGSKGLGREGGERRCVVDGAEDMEHGGGEWADFASCAIDALLPPFQLSFLLWEGVKSRTTTDPC